MLKEVGASGQISLGKKYAGQLFDLQTADDGSIVMRPVKVVPATATATVQETQAPYRVTPAAQQSNREWAETHAQDIALYNAWASQSEPYSQRVRRWREQGTTTAEQTHGTV